MKIRTLIIALAVAISSSALANEGSAIRVVSLKGSETFKVIYKGATTGDVKLTILDAIGNIIHSETLYRTDGFILPVNFGELSAGWYTVELTDSIGKHREKFFYQPTLDSKAIHVSRIPQDGNKFLVAISNANNDMLRIKIYDGLRRLVYDKSKVLSGDFAQVYRIENPLKHYTFEITDAAGNRKYFDF